MRKLTNIETKPCHCLPAYQIQAQHPENSVRNRPDHEYNRNGPDLMPAFTRPKRISLPGRDIASASTPLHRVRFERNERPPLMILLFAKCLLASHCSDLVLYPKSALWLFFLLLRRRAISRGRLFTWTAVSHHNWLHLGKNCEMNF